MEFSKSPHRLLQQIQRQVLVAWGSVWGFVLHRKPEVYAYIAKSLQSYPDRDELRRLVWLRGFQEFRSRRLLFGTLELLTFRAPQ